MSKSIGIGQRSFQITLSIGLALLLGVVAFVLSSRTTEPTQGNTTAPGIRTITDPIDRNQITAYAQLADAQTLALGETIYLNECASCHGVDGEGQFPQAPMEPDNTGRIGAPPHDGTGHTWHHIDSLCH